MADKYVFNPENISEIGSKNEEIKELLKQSFEHSKKFFEEMVDTDLWVGESKEQFMAFYHLLLQYHGWVAGENVPSYGALGSSVKVEANCAENLSEAFKSLYENITAFDSNSANYQELEGIS